MRWIADKETTRKVIDTRKMITTQRVAYALRDGIISEVEVRDLILKFK